jgi:integrase
LAREKTSFSDSFLKNIKPTDVRQEIIDDRGLGIWVQKMGKRIVGKPTITFFYRYTSPTTKKREYFSIGRYVEEESGGNSVTLAEARIKREEYEKLIYDGYDPKTHSSDAIGTLDKFAKTYIKEKVSTMAPQTQTTYKSVLNSKILPALGNKRLTKIKREEIIRLLDKVYNSSGFEMMRQTKKVLSSMYTYALDQLGFPGLENNVTKSISLKPWRNLEKKRPKDEKRWLRLAEIKKFWEYLDENKNLINDSHRRIWMLALLTASRPIEVVGMKWSDIGSHTLEDIHDLESIDHSRLWLRPAKLMKSDKPHLSYLSDLAIEIIEPLRNMPGDFVLWDADELKESQMISRRKYCGQLLKNIHGEYNELEKKEKRKKFPALPVDKFTQRDLRRTAATQMGNLGISNADIGKVLGHSDEEEGAQVTREHYNLAEYIHEKIIALTRWENQLRDTLNK